jgi:hypothetical protein
MKRSLLFILLLCPALLIAQLDVIRPGMSLAELQRNFPGLQHDFDAMTSRVAKKDSLLGLSGYTNFLISRDTAVRYQFTSEQVAGPCDKFPAADSAAFLKMMISARTLVSHYSDLFGKPATLVINPARAAAGEAWEVIVLKAEWKIRGDFVRIEVTRPGKSADEYHPNAMVDNRPMDRCYYVFDLMAEGTGREVMGEFGLGVSKKEFKYRFPDLAPQVEDFADTWRLEDSLTNKYASWQFQFVNDKLVAFSFDLYDGSDYGNESAAAYKLVLGRAQKLQAEAEKQFGKADSVTTKVPQEYPDRKISGNYYSRINYEVKWKQRTDLVIRMSEYGGGKQGQPVFHLEVHFMTKPE